MRRHGHFRPGDGWHLISRALLFVPGAWWIWVPWCFIEGRYPISLIVECFALDVSLSFFPCAFSVVSGVHAHLALDRGNAHRYLSTLAGEEGKVHVLHVHTALHRTAHIPKVPAS